MRKSFSEGENFNVSDKADVIFSNAVFHWIDEKDQEKMVENICNQLKTGGELVCEFGGYGCAESIHETLEKSFLKRGMHYPRTFYFPTISQYSSILEKHGFRVEFATLFERPTIQKTDEGLKNWINMFVTIPFLGIDEVLKNEIIHEAEVGLRDKLMVDGKWYVDYIRIRLRARKI